MRYRLFAVLALAGALSPARGFGQALAPKPILAESFRGRVTTDSGAVIVGADVILTMAPSAETFMTVTSATGEYTLSVPNGTGEYIIYISTLGRKPFRKRLTRAATDTIYVVDATLVRAVASVAAVKIEVSRAKPARSLGAATGTGTDGTDRTVDGVAAALPPELAGNFDAMGTLVPGIASTPSGLSAFGLSSDANQTTLNGLSFGGDLPRDARVATRFQLSPWDPAAGGFAGALIAATLTPGDNVAQRRSHVVLDNPALQFSDALAARTGQKTARLDVSAGGSGPLVLDEYFYNYGLQVSRASSSVASLPGLDALVLSHAGLSVDSAARILQLIGAAGIPVQGRGVPTARTTTSATFLERIDHAPSPAISGKTLPRTWALTAYGRYALTDGSSISSTATPDYAGTVANATAAVQGLSSSYLGRDQQILNETTTGISVSDRRSTPYSTLPTGNVAVVSAMPDGESALGAAAFGGNGMLANDLRTWSWETVNQTTFNPAGRATMPLHVYLQSKFAGFAQSLPSNRAGRFEYASIGDFADNTPTSYSRTLNSVGASGGEWTGAAAFGGAWTTGRVVWTGGLRADASAFLAAPAANADVARVFGLRNTNAPTDLGVSPRLGFNWYYTGSRPGAVSTTTGRVISMNRGASQIRGGFGEFRGSLPATLLSSAMENTGLADGSLQLRCVGSAVPMPVWTSYENDPSTIPDHCANGAPAQSDRAPSVTLFDRSFTAPRTWKGTLGWTTFNDLFYLAIDGTYALNRHQPSTIDLNFAGTRQLQLRDEGGRPVFTPADAIVSGTGATTFTSSRRSDAFGVVTDRVADLRSDARQFTVYTVPGLPLRWGTISLTYTYVDARGQARGFDQSTGSDPRDVEWSRVAIPRHQFVAQAYHYFAKPDMSFTASLRTASGLPFTPIVLGDVNGDGISNDRAFVFDPSTVGDASVARSMRDLLANSSGSTRTCLERQFGTIAGRNSCASPWSATMNAGLYFGHAIPGAQRAHLAINAFNVLAGADQLLHGANLRGWGATSAPDPVLLRVRGFDPAQQRFLYDVNGRFGSSSQSAVLSRAPFRLTFDVTVDLGRSPAAQRLEQNLRVRPGLVGTRAPADTIKKRYLAGFTDIYGGLLRMADSLALSADQIQRIERRRPSLLTRADSIYSQLTIYLAGLPEGYNSDVAVVQVNAATEAAWRAIYAEAPFLNELLGKSQIRRLPFAFREMLTIPGWKGRFFFAP